MEGALIQGVLMQGAQVEGALIQGVLMQGAQVEGALIQGVLMQGVLSQKKTEKGRMEIVVAMRGAEGVAEKIQ
jgi:uncharacterized protein YjbI with pentapeptide repeats